MEGVRRTHSPACPARRDRAKRCKCSAGWEAAVYDLEGNKVRRTFKTEGEAKAWRVDSLSRRQRGAFRAPRPTTVKEAADALIDGMRTGLVRTRSGERYKPSVIRTYKLALDNHVVPDMGGARLADVQRKHVQRIVDGLVAKGASASTVRNAIVPLRVIFRRAVEDGDIAHNPCEYLRLPRGHGRRETIVAPETAARMLQALTERRDRLVYGLAFYAGLRRGEIMGLPWRDIDLAGGIVHVNQALDVISKTITAPKSDAGRRRIPLSGALRGIILDYRLEQGEIDPEARAVRFDVGSLAARVKKAWTAAGLEPVSLHEARHTAASLWIAAGIDAKALQTYMGHSSIATTYDLYGHLLPGSEREHAALMDALLERADTAARLAVFDESENAAGS